MELTLPPTPTDFISGLPEELSFAILDHFELRPCLVRVSHLSKHWRTLAHSHSTFWQDINVHDSNYDAPNLFLLSLAVAQLQSSQNLGIRVKLDIKGVRGWQTVDTSPVKHIENLPGSGNIEDEDSITYFCTVLIQNLHRISSLFIGAPHVAHVTLAQRLLFATPAPHLETLELYAFSRREDKEKFIFRWSAITFMPRLRSLRLQRINAAPISTDKAFLLSPHNELQDLVLRRLSRNAAAPGSSLNELLEQFPKLHTIQLFNISTPSINSPDQVGSRLASFRNISLPDEFIVQLGVARLLQVQHLRVNYPSVPTIQLVLEHFFSSRPADSGDGNDSLSLPPLEIDGRTEGIAGWSGCPLCFTELAPNGRRRDFDIKSYVWLPDISAFKSLAHRVTRLAIPIRDWPELFEALDGGPALEELVLRVLDLDELSQECPVIRSAKLSRVVLQSAHEGDRTLAISVGTVVALAKRIISPELHGQAQLKLDGISWVGTIQDVLERLGVYFESVDF